MHEFPLGEPRAVRDEYLDFDAGHGTFVAGIVLQIAPDAEIKVYRAVDSDGIGSEVTVACKMIQAVLEGYKIINLSLSCQTQDDFPPVAIQAALEVIKEIERDRETPESHRALFIAAAGNYGNTRPSWPAAFPGVVAVACLGPGLQPSLWSSRGFWVDCSTIGEGVLSTYVPGRESPLVTSTPVEFMRPGSLGAVERYVVRRAADRWHSGSRIPGQRNRAPGSAGRALGGGPADPGVRAGHADPSGCLNDASLPDGVSTPPRCAL